MPFYEYLGPFESVEVDEAADIRQGETVEVHEDRAAAFDAAPDSWRPVDKAKRRKPRRPDPTPDTDAATTTEES